QERNIRLLAESHSLPDLDAEKARLQRTLSKLDDEVFTLEKEILDSQVQRDLLQKKITSNRVEPDPAVVEAMVVADFRVAQVMNQRAAKQAAMEEWARKSGPESPAMIAYRQEIAALDKKLAEVRAAVKPEIEASLKAAALKPLKEKAADLEDKLTVTVSVLERRK